MNIYNRCYTTREPFTAETIVFDTFLYTILKSPEGRKHSRSVVRFEMDGDLSDWTVVTENGF